MKSFQRFIAGGFLCAGVCSIGSIAWAQANAPAQGSAVAADAAVADAVKPTKEQLLAERNAAKEADRKAKELKRLYGEGPYPGELEAFLASKPEKLKPLLTTLYTGGERNAVLNFNRLGLAAMEIGEWSLAEKSFDLALQRIEAVYSKNKQAEQAKSAFKKEARKDFKGEPYERAMAYYYRGILYLRAEDYDNARASFAGALYQDSINLEGERGQDFASMNYLAGWASKCGGDASIATEQFDFATKAKADLKAPAADANTLLIAELGLGPSKIKGGANKELLEFQSNASTKESAADVAGLGAKDGDLWTPVEAASLSYQASERDGRKMDGVLKQKSDTKNALNAAGQSMMTNSYNYQGGAMAGMLGGLALSLFSSAMRADADIRQWDSLPEHIMLAAGPKPAKLGAPKVSYKADKAALELQPAATIVAEGKRCSFVWTRSRSALDVPAETPGDDAGVAKASASRKDVQLKNKAFRDSLSVL